MKQHMLCWYSSRLCLSFPAWPLFRLPPCNWQNCRESCLKAIYRIICICMHCAWSLDAGVTKAMLDSLLYFLPRYPCPKRYVLTFGDTGLAPACGRSETDLSSLPTTGFEKNCTSVHSMDSELKLGVRTFSVLSWGYRCLSVSDAHALSHCFAFTHTVTWPDSVSPQVNNFAIDFNRSRMRFTVS